MGFSLESFFASLQAIIDDSDEDLREKYLWLKHEIEFQYKYAKQCGQVS